MDGSIEEENTKLKDTIKSLEREISDRARNYMIKRQIDTGKKNISMKSEAIQTENQFKFQEGIIVERKQINIRGEQREENHWEIKICQQNLQTPKKIRPEIYSNRTQKQQLYQPIHIQNQTKTYFNNPLTNQIHWYQKQIEELNRNILLKEQLNLQLQEQIRNIGIKLDQEKLSRIQLEQQINFIKEQYRDKSQIERQKINDLEQILLQCEKIDLELAHVQSKNRLLEKQLQAQREKYNYAKEALLKSQEENYNFRLQLRKAMEKFKLKKQDIENSFLSVDKSTYNGTLNKGVDLCQISQIQAKVFFESAPSRVDANDVFRSKISQQLHKIVTSLPIVQNQDILFQPQNDNEIFIALSEIKNFCQCFEENYKKTQHSIVQMEIKFSKILINIIKQYNLNQNCIMEYIGDCETFINLRSHIHQYYMNI